MQIANAAEGEYVDGNDTQAVVDFVVETLKDMDYRRMTSDSYFEE